MVDFDTWSHSLLTRINSSASCKKLADEKQAEGLTEAMRSAIDESELVTKKDLQIELAPLKADLNLLKWMMGALIAIAIANFSKQLF